MGINDCELLSTSINFGVEDFTDAIHLPISIDGEFSGFKEPCTPTAGSPPIVKYYKGCSLLVIAKDSSYWNFPSILKRLKSEAPNPAFILSFFDDEVDLAI